MEARIALRQEFCYHPPEKKTACVQPRLPDNREALEAFESGEVKYEVLGAGDCR
jgi:hypothetical protein